MRIEKTKHHRSRVDTTKISPITFHRRHPRRHRRVLTRAVTLGYGVLLRSGQNVVLRVPVVLTATANAVRGRKLTIRA